MDRLEQALGPFDWHAMTQYFHTTYDPAVYSDTLMLEMAKRAGAKALEKYRIDRSKRIFSVEFGGVDFRVYFGPDDGTGGAYISDIHPAGRSAILFDRAFGGLDCDDDPMAAVKICLESLSLTGNLSVLQDLLVTGAPEDSCGGDPGWLLERRDLAPSDGGEAWPGDVMFHAAVDPDEFKLGVPQCFCSRPGLMPLVHAIVAAHLATYPKERGALKGLLTLLKQPGYALPTSDRSSALARPWSKVGRLFGSK